MCLFVFYLDKVHSPTGEVTAVHKDVGITEIKQKKHNEVLCDFQQEEELSRYKQVSPLQNQMKLGQD